MSNCVHNLLNYKPSFISIINDYMRQIAIEITHTIEAAREAFLESKQ